MNENHFDVEKMKKWLKRYCTRERDLDSQSQRLEYVETKLSSLSSPTLSDMPKARNSFYDRTTDLISLQDELVEYIEKGQKEQKLKRRYIETLVGNLPHPDEMAVIRMKYIDGLCWNDITYFLFGCKTDFVDKEETYLRRAHKIHSSALVNLTNYVEKNPIPDDYLAM